MDFTLQGADPRFLHLKRRLEADGHRLVPDGGLVIAPPAEGRGVPYARDPVYAVKNAALTAEGAAELLMRRSDRSLADMRVLVAGYGRIGRLLARKLSALGVRVTVAARDPADRAEAEARGYAAVGFDRIPAGFSAVINTVPAPVLRGDYGAEHLIDLASAPGGWADGTAVLRAPGLPGVYAPAAAADIMAEAVYRVLEEDDHG